MKRPLVRGLVAEIEGKLFFVGDLAGGWVVAGGLDIERAMAEPVMLCHRFDERGFGEGVRVVFFAEGSEELVEIGLRFGGEDAEGSG